MWISQRYVCLLPLTNTQVPVCITRTDSCQTFQTLFSIHSARSSVVTGFFYEAGAAGRVLCDLILLQFFSVQLKFCKFLCHLKFSLPCEDSAASAKIIKRVQCAAVKSSVGLNWRFVLMWNLRMSVFEVWSLVTAEVWSLIQMLIQIIRNVDFHLACCKARLREEVCVCVCVIEEVNGYTGCVYVPGRQTDRQTGNRPLAATERDGITEMWASRRLIAVSLIQITG